MNKIAKIRGMRFRQQNACCHYCKEPMWATDSAQFAETYQMTSKQTLWRQATAEHLTPRSEGGSDQEDNIVAACRFCNGRRHRRKSALSADAFGKWVQTRMARGKWHPVQLVINVKLTP